MSNATLSSPLTDEEIAAGSAYGADSLFFHACWQGRADDLVYDPRYAAFAKTYDPFTRALDTAVAKSVLHEETIVYSGHGRGYSILGSLTGELARFVGLTYQYPGFISTSQSRLFAEDKFLRPGAYPGTRPTLLEFRLRSGQPALDMHMVGHTGEIEYLLPRERPFTIVDAREIQVHDVQVPVIHLTLIAATWAF